MFCVGCSVRDLCLVFSFRHRLLHYSLIYRLLSVTLPFLYLLLTFLNFRTPSRKDECGLPYHTIFPFSFSSYYGCVKHLMCSVFFHERIRLLYEVHLAHVAFLQKRIDFVKQVARYHSLKIAARRLTLLLILRLVFAICLLYTSPSPRDTR